MIYFLVNNDYQLVDARQHLGALHARGFESVLIEVPHALKEPDRGQGFGRVVALPSPARAMRWLESWRDYRHMPRTIADRILPRPDDTLFFYTEFELANHMVVRHFKAAGSRVYLLEDGGFATYVPFCARADEPLTPKERIIARMTRWLPGMGDTRFPKINGQVFPWLPDELVDGLGVYRDIAPLRRLDVHLLERDDPPAIVSVRGRAIFLNQPMYDHFQTADDYMAGLQRIMAALCSGFDDVLFKFHPRESPEWTQRITQMLTERTPRVRILQDRQPFEQLASQWKPEVLASYFSAALLNIASGVEPLYLYHLLPAVSSQPVFAQTTALLKHWNYRFATSFEAIRTGYQSGLSMDARAQRASLADLASRRH